MTDRALRIQSRYIQLEEETRSSTNRVSFQERKTATWGKLLGNGKAHTVGIGSAEPDCFMRTAQNAKAVIRVHERLYNVHRNVS